MTGRYQLKDCTSKAGVDKTLSQVRSGKYHSTKLMGTSETKQAYDATKTRATKPCIQPASQANARAESLTTPVSPRGTQKPS
ncbi:MAG: hypothetical protein IJU76_11655 [Desulfovibrionaceae bacterium]|nr:hypothetical protein [Desulfovibrionaceae bacterium]